MFWDSGTTDTLEPFEDPFLKIYKNGEEKEEQEQEQEQEQEYEFYTNLYGNLEESSSDYDSEPEINTTEFENELNKISLFSNTNNKYIRLWIPPTLVNNNNIHENWNEFTTHIEKMDEIINNKKINTEYTSNKNFSLMFKEITDSYKKHCPNEYKLLNSQIILQHRLEFFMKRHTQLLNTF